MSLLDFARGPGMRWALIVFAAGTLYRLVGALFLVRTRSLAAPRHEATFGAGVRTIFTRFWVHRDFTTTSAGHLVLAYVYHVGLVIVLLLFVPHIEFFGGVLGFTWPGLSTSVITSVAALSTGALVAVLVRRLRNPVLRTISTFDDYFSWFALFAPFLTGICTTAHIVHDYPNLLAVHLLSVELLLCWFPFGKLMHAILFVPTRYATGAAFYRRGVRA